MPYAISNLPGIQHGGMYDQCSLKSTWPSACCHVCQVQSQINLVISMVACMLSTDSGQTGQPSSGMYAQFILKSTLQSFWWHVCPMQSQIKLAISMVACMSNADSNKPGH